MKVHRLSTPKTHFCLNMHKKWKLPSLLFYSGSHCIFYTFLMVKHGKEPSLFWWYSPKLCHKRYVTYRCLVDHAIGTIKEKI